MIRFLSLVIVTVLISFPAQARKKKAPILENNKAYVVYLEGCPICEQAMNYINERYYTRPDVVRVNIETEEGAALLKQCAKKFNFNRVLVPVICIGDKYFMGWSDKASKNFDQYLVELHE